MPDRGATARLVASRGMGMGAGRQEKTPPHLLSLLFHPPPPIASPKVRIVGAPFVGLLIGGEASA